MTGGKRPWKDEGLVSAVEYGLLVALIVAIGVLAIQGVGWKWNSLFSNVKNLIESSPVAPARTQRQAN